MPDLLDVLGVKDQAQRTLDLVQARVGDWLALPQRLREAQARTADAAIMDRIGQLLATYQATRPTVEAGLQIAQRAAASRVLPSLADLGTVAAAAANLVQLTKDGDTLIRQAGGAAAPGTGGGAWKVVAALAGVAAVVVLVRRRRRRR